MIYLIGSMRNPQIPIIANRLRKEGFDIFDDWYSPGKNADDEWQIYEQQRGRPYREAIKGYHAEEVFTFDKTHLDRCDAAVLTCPAGKSAHMELGYIIGSSKPGYILLPGEPERFDIMYRFATEIFLNVEELIECLSVNGQAKLEKATSMLPEKHQERLMNYLYEKGPTELSVGMKSWGMKR